MSKDRKTLLKRVEEYYTGKIITHGPSHEGVDWTDPQKQLLRFDQALKILGDDKDASVLDYGCGYGALGKYMREQGFRGQYLGYDISEEMVKVAISQLKGVANCALSTDINALGIADYAITSGIFNVKHDTSDEEWLTYLLETVNDIASHSRKGFSFNCLTSYSDPGKKRPDLYYADPALLFDYCMRNYSHKVALLHDYWWEFTIHVRLI